MARRRRRDGGFVTVEYVAAIAISMLVLVVAANFIVVEYGRGVVRSALTQGVHDGGRSATPVPTCTQSARQALADLLGSGPGSMGGQIAITCSSSGTMVGATATGAFPSWLPFLPSFGAGASVQAPLEPVEPGASPLPAPAPAP